MGNISGAVVSNLKVDVFSKTMETNIKGTSKYRPASYFSFSIILPMVFHNA